MKAPDDSSLQMSTSFTHHQAVCRPAQLQLRQGAAQVGLQVSGCSLSPRLPPDPSPSGPSAHELRVALCTCYYDIHPDPHGLWGRGHHVIEAVVGFHTEGQRRVGALGGTAQVIVINLFNRLKVNEPFQLGLMLVHVIREVPLETVKNEPAFLP